MEDIIFDNKVLDNPIEFGIKYKDIYDKYK